MPKSEWRRRGRLLGVALAAMGGLLISLVPVAASASPGQMAWVTPNGSLGSAANAVGVSPDGTRVYVTGYTYTSATADDYATFAYDAPSGTTIWEKRYNGPANQYDMATALGVSPDGTRVYVTGLSEGPASNYGFVTIAYDAASGARIWVRRYDSLANVDDEATALAVSPDGTSVYVAGTSYGSRTGYDYATVAYDAASGMRRWARRYNDPANGADDATALGVSPDGARVYVTGTSYGSTTENDYATVAYDTASGTRLWVKRYNGPASAADDASALGVSSDGTSVYVTGTSYGSSAGYDYATVAYSAASGTRLWVKRYNGPAGSYDLATALAVSEDGTRVYVTGTSEGTIGEDDYATVAYDAASGARVWVRRYNSSANNGDRATALGVSPDGTRVYVTGQSTGAGSSDDYATIAYDAGSGSRIWVSRYGPGPRNSDPNALGVSPDGNRVYVTGSHVTVAYDTS